MNSATIRQIAVEQNSMSETYETKKGKKLELSAPGKLELNKTIETGSVRQSFSHGRSKMVAVEVKKKRVFAPDSGGQMAEIKKAAGPLVVPPAPEEVVVADKPVAAMTTPSGRVLTNEERASRMKALEGAREQDETKRIKAELEDLAPAPDETAVVPEPVPSNPKKKKDNGEYKLIDEYKPSGNLYNEYDMSNMRKKMNDLF